MPYKDRGCGPDHFDCVGIVVYLYKKIWDIELFHITLRGDETERYQIQKFSKPFIRIEPKRSHMHSGDVIHFKPPREDQQHLVMVENPNWAVQCDLIACGVERIELHRVLIPKSLVYRHKDLC